MLVKDTFFAYTWFLAALTFTLSIGIFNGYNIGVFLIFLASFSLLLIRPRWTWSELTQEDKVLFFTFLAYALSVYLSVFVDDWRVRDLDRPSKFILALPVLLLLLKATDKRHWLWYGVIGGATLSFILAYYQRNVLGFERAKGSEHPIMFGNTGLLLGALCFTSAILSYSSKRHLLLILSIFGGVMGIGVSVLSATRGGWVALPVVAFFLIWQSRFLLGRKAILTISLLSILCASIVMISPQTGVKDRIDEAIEDVIAYNRGTRIDTSVGLRFEMWKAAWHMFQDSPLIGVGKNGSAVFKEKLVEDGLVSSKILDFTHAHNEYINALSLRGVIGLVCLGLVYLIPLRLFLRKIHQYPDNWKVKSYAMGGALIPMCYMDFSLTQVMFGHNIGVIMYAFPITFFWAATRWAEREERELGNIA